MQQARDGVSLRFPTHWGKFLVDNYGGGMARNDGLYQN